MGTPKKIEQELKDALRKIDSAKTVLGSELGKGGNLPFAYSELQAAKQALERVIRNIS